MAYLSSFEYTPFKEPINGAIGVARFNIKGDGPPGNDDWEQAFSEFKRDVPWTIREWSEEERLWTVRVFPKTKERLCGIFDNAAELFEIAERQMRLFE